LTDVSLPIPDELIYRIAESIAERAFSMLAERVGSPTPWMTTDEAVAYTRIPPGTFEKLAARGRVPSHSVDGGRRKLYHREELDHFLGHVPLHLAPGGTSVMGIDAA
jgi:excisionase family DNA binding protein